MATRIRTTPTLLLPASPTIFSQIPFRTLFCLQFCRRGGEVIASMTRRESSSEVLKDAGDHMVDMEDLFGNPKKEWRNPLVLCGAVATAGVLVAGLASFRQGNFRTSQMLMRTRVAFQAGTVALMAGTVYYQGKS